MGRRCLPVLVAGMLAAGPGHAQDVDVLSVAPPTAFYVETDVVGNDGLTDCDWYHSADAFLDGEDGIGSGCQVNVRIRGALSRDGAFRFYSLVERLEALGHRVAAVELDSRGGDADRREKVFEPLPDTLDFAIARRRVVAPGGAVELSGAVDAESRRDGFGDVEFE